MGEQGAIFAGRQHRVHRDYRLARAIGNGDRNATCANINHQHTIDEAFEAGDFRLGNPRFSEANFGKNLELVTAIQDIAERRNCSAAQLALAWVMSRGDDIVPIPGTRSVTRLEDNAGAADIVLSPEELAAIDVIMPPGVAIGTRYSDGGMRSLDG